MGEISNMDDLIKAVKETEFYPLYRKAVKENTKNTVDVLKATLKLGNVSEVRRIDKAIDNLAKSVLFTVLDQILKNDIEREEEHGKWNKDA